MARPLWNGSIAFGLVSIPIGLYTSLKDRTVHFHMMTPDGKCRLQRRLVCPDTGKEYDFSSTARGYEIAPHQYVLVDPKELKTLRPESGDTIELEQFIDLEEIEPHYFERSYFALPQKSGEKAYSLLHKALRESKKIGIGEFIMHEKEHLVAVRAGEEALYVDTLHFEEEIKKVDEITESDLLLKVSDKELTIATQLIDSLTGQFKPSQYRDDYRKEVLAMLQRKAKGKKGPVVVTPHETKKDPKVIDLMERLEASLKHAPKARGGTKHPRRASSR